MSSYSARNASALRSYDAMLARGDGKGDEPIYTAPVVIDRMVLTTGKYTSEVREDLGKHLDEIDSLLIYREDDGVVAVEVTGSVNDVQAGTEEDLKDELWTALEGQGYEPDSMTVHSYEDVMETMGY